MAFIKCQYTDDYLLTCVQLGISIADLDLLTIGLVNDMFTERQNDGYSYKELAISRTSIDLKVRLILLDFADYLIYYTRKEVTYELLTHEYNYWR